MDYRTDLALERIQPDEGGIPEGIDVLRRGKAFGITEIVIPDDSFRESIGKGSGRYITLEAGSLSRFSSDHSAMAQELAGELSALVPEGEVLVAGIGNSDITPDALGPETAAKVLATRHLREELCGDDFLCSLRRVSVIAGGVLGQTGIETAELIRAVCRELRPAAVIAVDALACSEVSRLGTTVQITDTGISPGSGVANARRELTERTLGIPVIAVGVPTVADMRVIARDLTGAEPAESTDLPEVMVTPRDIDRLTERASQLIACGINLALHPSLSYEDAAGLF